MMRRHVRVPLALCAAAGLAACSGHADGGPGIAHSVAIQPQSAALCVGDSQAFTAQVLDVDGNPVAGAPVRWSSSAPEHVSIDTSSGMAHALAFGPTVVTASARGITSNRGALDVPQDVVPEPVPDTVVLAPTDTMTIGAGWRRLSAGPVPSRIPVLMPFNSAVAALDSTGLLRAKAVGTVGLSLSACGFQGHGGVKVYTASDSVTGQAYLWLSGPAELRASLPAQALTYRRTNTQPAFQVFSNVSGHARTFVYVGTAPLLGPGVFTLDSLNSAELSAQVPCSPPRPFAIYQELSPQTALFSMHGGTAAVTTYVPYTNSTYVSISGRMSLRMRGLVRGGLTLDTLQVIYTFSAPLKDTLNVCL